MTSGLNIFELDSWIAFERGDYKKVDDIASSEAVGALPPADQAIRKLLAGRGAFETGKDRLIDRSLRFLLSAEALLTDREPAALSKEPRRAETALARFEEIIAVLERPVSEAAPEGVGERAVLMLLAVEFVHFIIKRKELDILVQAVPKLTVVEQAIGDDPSQLELFILLRVVLARAIMRSRSGDLPGATSHFDQAEDLIRRLGGPSSLNAEFWFWRGQALAWRMERALALDGLQRAMTIWMMIGNRSQAMLTAYEVASLYRDLRQPDNALNLFRSVAEFQANGGRQGSFDLSRVEIGDSTDLQRTCQAIASTLIVKAEMTTDLSAREALLDEAEDLTERVVSAEAGGGKPGYRSIMALINQAEARLLRDDPLLRRRAKESLERAHDICRTEIDEYARAHNEENADSVFAKVVLPLIGALDGKDAEEKVKAPEFEYLRLAQLESEILVQDNPEAGAARLKHLARAFSSRLEPSYEVGARIKSARAYLKSAEAALRATASEPVEMHAATYINYAEKEVHRAYRLSASSDISMRNITLPTIRKEIAALKRGLQEMGVTGVLAVPEPSWIHDDPEYSIGAPVSSRGVETTFAAHQHATGATAYVKIYDLSKLDAAYQSAQEKAVLEWIIADSAHIAGVPTLTSFHTPRTEAEGWFAFAQEQVHGQPLRNFMWPPREPSHRDQIIEEPNTILGVVYDLAETMRELQLRGLTCCMLSPTAVILEPGLRPVIVSFGGIQRGGADFARDLQSQWLRPFAPEKALRARRPAMDQTWDIYALGVLLGKWIYREAGPDRFKRSRVNYANVGGFLKTGYSVLFTAREPKPKDLRMLIDDLLNPGHGRDGSIDTLAEAASRIQKLISY